MTIRQRIFISYRHLEPDQTVARAVGDALDAEYEVFADWKIAGGQRWGDVIETELQTCEAMIAFTSKESGSSDMVLAEVATAYNAGRSGKPIIIPVRVAFDGPLRYPLKAYLEFSQQLSWNTHADTPRLIGQIQAALQSEPNKPSPVPRSQTDDQRKRAGLLKQIRLDYVEALLAQSLYSVAPIQLGFLSDSGSVERPINAIVTFADQAPEPLPPGTRITEIFDRSAGALLLLGEPGTGKTTLLLELARDLLDRADRDESQPIPVVVNLSSWALRPQKLRDWLVQDLNQRNHFPPEKARQWFADQKFLPLLDGLDEVAPDRREDCAAAINQFRREFGFLPIAICSRVQEYGELNTRLELRTAIVVQPLTRPQIESYLAGVGQPLLALRAALDREPSLWELLRTPLMLWVTLLGAASSGNSRSLDTQDAESLRDTLFSRYVDEMLRREHGARLFTREQTLRWLSWLAYSMKRLNQSAFQLERLNRRWTPRFYQQAILIVIPVALCSLIGWWISVAGHWIITGTPGHLIGAISGAAAGACLLWMFRDVPSTYWRWTLPSLNSLLIAAIVVPGALALVSGIGWLFLASKGFNFKAALWTTSILILWIIALTGFTEAVQEHVAPNEATRRSGKTALLTLFFSGPIYWMFFRIPNSQPIWEASMFATGSALCFGGLFFISHWLTRLLLFLTNAGPARYIAFLDDCVDRLLLRRAGGSYLFMHRMLLDYLAGLHVSSK